LQEGAGFGKAPPGSGTALPKVDLLDIIKGVKIADPLPAGVGKVSSTVEESFSYA